MDYGLWMMDDGKIYRHIIYKITSMKYHMIRGIIMDIHKPSYLGQHPTGIMNYYYTKN